MSDNRTYVTKTVANFKDRETALTRHIRALAPNLVKDYLCELITGAEEKTVDQFVITMRAQNAVPAKTFVDVDTLPVRRFEQVEDEDEYIDDGEPNL